LASSISIAEREEGPAGIADVIRCEKTLSNRQYGTASPRKKAVASQSEAAAGNFRVKPGSGFDAFLQSYGVSGG
jgi:hypothetical protein